MSANRNRRAFFWISVGPASLAVSLLLAMVCVGIVHAEGELECSPPDVVAEERPPVRVVPATGPEGEIEMAPRGSIEPGGAASDVVVLNTRGYNYGPDRPTVRPEAAAAPAAPAASPQD
jgi:hypothetical protein